MKLIDIIKGYENLELDDSKVKALKELLVIEDSIFIPYEQDEVYFIGGNGEINSYIWKNRDSQIDAFFIGNCFKTKKEAEFELERLKVIAELKRFALIHNQWKLNWYDLCENKYCMEYDFYRQAIAIANYYELKHNDIYFSSIEILSKAIQSVGEERIKKYYLDVDNVRGC